MFSQQSTVQAITGEVSESVTPVLTTTTDSRSRSATGSEERSQIKEFKNEVGRLRAMEENRSCNGSRASTSVTAAIGLPSDRKKPYQADVKCATGYGALRESPKPI